MGPVSTDHRSNKRTVGSLSFHPGFQSYASPITLVVCSYFKETDKEFGCWVKS